MSPRRVQEKPPAAQVQARRVARREQVQDVWLKRPRVWRLYVPLPEKKRQILDARIEHFQKQPLYARTRIFDMVRHRVDRTLGYAAGKLPEVEFKAFLESNGLAGLRDLPTWRRAWGVSNVDEETFDGITLLATQHLNEIEHEFGYPGLCLVCERLLEQLLTDATPSPPPVSKDEHQEAFRVDAENQRLLKRFQQLRADAFGVVESGPAAIADGSRHQKVIRLLKRSENHASASEQQEQEAGMPSEMPRAAKGEATKRRYGNRFRKGRRLVAAYLEEDDADNLKAIAAANGLGVTAYVEQLLSTTIKDHRALIPVGQEKLNAPKRYRSRAVELEAENRKLRRQLRGSGAKPQ